LSDLNTKDLLCVAKQVATKAGNLLKERHTTLLKVVLNEKHDLKLEIESTVENLIRSELAEKSSLPVLGEEFGTQDLNLLSKTFWVIDPLDGTVNYYKNNPVCCVSIGIWNKMGPLIGVVFNFHTNEMFCGDTSSMHASFNRKQLKIFPITNTDQAVYSTGFPLAMDLDSRAKDRFFQKVQKYKKVRMIGSAALSLAYVASGKFDIYEEESIRLWDVAAGLAIVTAAGGSIEYKFTDLKNFVLNVKATA
jgi:myo-inositol-1(or 4)-monophosphatase